ncbi:MAG: type II toxin-antitoxin system VapC family toxin [Dongiaceae bacterium]
MSYLLDTNVISETRRRNCDARVKRWIESVGELDLNLSVVVIGELRQGIERLRRRDAHQATLLDFWLSKLKEDFSGRVFRVSLEIAEEWGRLDVPDPLPPMDGLLIATAKVHGLMLVSRDVKGAQRAGVQVINPWQDG